jgi:hypothetical protein
MQHVRGAVLIGSYAQLIIEAEDEFLERLEGLKPFINASVTMAGAGFEVLVGDTIE